MKLWSYTREPIDNVYYDARLAYSMHLAIEKDNGEIIDLNHNSGILFAKADENEDGSLEPKCMKYPCIFSTDKGFYIYAVRTLADGEEEAETKGKVCAFSTNDFVEYQEIGLVDAPQEYLEKLTVLQKHSLNDAKIVPEGAYLCSSVDISDDVTDYLMKKFRSATHVKTVFPQKVTVGSQQEFLDIKAQKTLSDGTVCKASVDWNLDNVDFNKPGEYEIEGSLHQDHYPFPVATNRADPCIGRWNGKYYFIATNDADDNHTLYIREADSIPDLVSAKEYLILDSVTHKGIGGLLWAPEFHIIGGKLCILHAATPEPFFEEESHILMLKEGGNPIHKDDWEAPRRIVRSDGSNICEAGKEITLDMTHFNWEGTDYVIWSQRQFLPKDLGAWLYIAKLDPNIPWKLASDPVLLTKPEYGWENNHTFVVEGPYALLRENVLFITYSAAAVDTSYVVGLLSIPKGKNLLDASNWKKRKQPILTSRSVIGEFGTGHNAYCEDENGDIWNSYHARPGVDAPRSSGIRQVFFDIDGEPVLDITEDMALNQGESKVKTTVVVPVEV